MRPRAARYGDRMRTSSSWARGWSIARGVMAVLIFAAIVAQLIDTTDSSLEMGRHLPTVWANFFSFFTILSNTLAAIVLAWAAAWSWTRGRLTSIEPVGLAVCLACVTTYMVITGIVYNTLLRGIQLLPGNEPVWWSNEVLHLVGPLFLLADLFFGPYRRALPWQSLWAIVAFPILWAIYTMIRGPFITNPSTGDSAWYPYPFLNPANFDNGYVGVAMYIVGIAVAIIAVGSFVVWWGRRVGRRMPEAEASVETAGSSSVAS